MLERFCKGVVTLGGAAVAAVFLYWLAVEAIGTDYRDVFQGSLVTAGIIGIAYHILPRLQR